MSLKNIFENRGGEFEIFDTSINYTKVMQASSHPYQSATIYQRTIVQIQHENINDYIVDIFRSNGGSKRRELVYHGPNNDYEINNKLIFNEPYEITPANSYIEVRVRSQMTFEIADISLCDTTEDGSRGKELLRDIPKNPPTDECTNETDFCYTKYKKTEVEYTVIDGPTKGKKAIRFTASNADFLIGHSKCFLLLKENARYLLEFKVKGEKFVDKIRLKYNGKEAEFKKTSLNMGNRL